MGDDINPGRDLERIASQERILRFSQFDHEAAFGLGNHLKSLAERNGVTLAIEVRLAQQTIFFCSMRGTTPENADWVRRKRNLVELTHRSSYSVALMGRLDSSNPLEKMGLPLRDYAAFGGGFPIWVSNIGCIGAVTVSGVPQRQDHALVVEALAELLDVPLNQVSLD